MAQRIVGIDVGAHSIKVVQLSASMRNWSVTAYAEETIAEAVSSAEAGDDSSAAQTYYARAGAALRRLKERGALRGDIFVTGVPGHVATTRLVRLPFADHKRIEAVLRFEIEAQVPYDLDDMVLTSTALQGQIEGKTDVLVGMAKRSDVAAFLEMLRAVGVDPRHLELDALVLDDLFRHVLARGEEEQPLPQVTPGGTALLRDETYAEAVALVDVGHTHTAICVMVDDQVVAARTILRGGADLTRALARTFELGLAEAEDGKVREAFIEVDSSPAPYPEQQRISQCLKQALAPFVRELRQSFQAVIAQRRARISRVYLFGGGARVQNLERYLAQELNITVRRAQQIGEVLAPVLPVETWQGAADMSHAGKALAFALSGFAAHKSERLDFRQDEFAYRGNFEVLEGRAPQLVAGLMVIALLLGFNGYAQHFVLSRQEAQIAERQTTACKKILGREVTSAERCLAMIKEQIRGGPEGTGIPERSAIDAYLEVARATPPDVEIKVEELEVSLDKVRVKAQTDSYESVDKIVAGLEKGRCFTNVQRGQARQDTNGKVGYSVTVDVSCETQAEVARK